MSRLHAIAFGALLACGTCHARLPAKPLAMKTPTMTEVASDPRFQTVAYTGGIIRVQSRVGRMLEIEFAKDETDILPPHMGDREAWYVKVVGNAVHIKQKAAHGDTNMLVIAGGRKYWFDLVTVQDAKTIVPWHINFTYPLEKAKPVAPTPATTAKLIDARLSAALNEVIAEAGPMPANSGKLNDDYGFMAVDNELKPISVYNNGDATFIQFAPNNPMPTVFSVEPDGSESRVNFHVEKDIFIIHRVVKHLIFRRGSATACVINGSFQPGGTNESKTSAADVQRVLKGNKNVSE